MPRSAPSLRDRAQREMLSARERLLTLQRDGHWRGVFDIGVLTDAADVMHRHYFGIATRDTDRRAAECIWSTQLPDGSWNSYYGGAGRVTNTVAAYVALRLTGVDRFDDKLLLARHFILEAGGVEAVEPQVAIWLALLGLWDWHDFPAVPPEIVLVPRWAPLSLHDMAWWTNAMLIPIAVCAALRPTRTCGFDIDELRAWTRPGFIEKLPAPVQSLVRTLDIFRASPFNALRPRALQKCRHWLVNHQDDDGLFGGGLLLATQFSTVALAALGCDASAPPMRTALEALESLVVDDAGLSHVQLCNSAVADTGLALGALIESGVAPEHPAIRDAVRWLVSRQALQCDDAGGASRVVGGWGWQDGNALHPDTDDTEVVATSLRAACGYSDPVVNDAIGRAGRWVARLQLPAGGWQAFEDRYAGRLPMRDFFERHQLVDAATVDVTARAVEWLEREGTSGHEIDAAIDWISRQQRSDGRWDSTWGCSVQATASCIQTLRAVGTPADDTRVSRGVAWLTAHQNADGGWGESPAACRDRRLAGAGPSTLEQTSLVLLGLMKVLDREHPSIEAGIRFILSRAWTGANLQFAEPVYWFPVSVEFDLWSRSQLFPLVFPLKALAGYVGMWAGSSERDGVTGRAFDVAPTHRAVRQGSSSGGRDRAATSVATEPAHGAPPSSTRPSCSYGPIQMAATSSSSG